uniref:Large ribosomal subunit protein bL28c n=1 Tax=Aegilops tauschii TaxID=37682 RepID=M8CD55_AEGTA
MASMLCSYSVSMPAAARAPLLRSSASSSAPSVGVGRICPFLEKKTNRANKVSFSNHKTKKQQFVNLQYKKLWWEAGKRYVKLRLSTKALKTIEKHGLDAVAKKAGIDLNKK